MIPNPLDATPMGLPLRILGFFRRLPRGVWIGAAIIAILLLGTCAHKRAVTKAYDAAYNKGKADEGQRIAAKALKIAADATRISVKLKELNNEENRRIAGDARTVLLRGPGKASCFNTAAPGPGRRQPPAGQTGPAVDPLPAGEGLELIGLPFAGAVSLAEEHDLCIAEAKTWREWHRQLVADWEKQQ